jgi:L-asparagine transporter-like permease
VAGAAVWLSFLIAGVIAALQGYSFAKLGARYPSAGGLLEYVSKGFGEDHVTGVTVWLTYAANAIVTAMVAVSFGSYASAMFANENAAWAKVFAVLIIVAMTAVNVVGSKLVANAQTVIVYVVLGILVVFAVVTLVNMNPDLLAPSGYPPLRDIISSVALTFFAFLRFGIITVTAKDLERPGGPVHAAEREQRPLRPPHDGRDDLSGSGAAPLCLHAAVHRRGHRVGGDEGLTTGRATLRNPDHPGYFADPYVIRANGRWPAVGTGRLTATGAL